MANGMNKVFLLGNLGREPELKVSSGGVTQLRLRLATTERYRDKNDDWQEHTEWHTVTVWGKRAEALASLLGKGARVMVEGNIRTSSYEKDGITRYFTEIRARDIYLTGARHDTVDDAPPDSRPMAVVELKKARARAKGDAELLA